MFLFGDPERRDLENKLRFFHSFSETYAQISPPPISLSLMHVNAQTLSLFLGSTGTHTHTHFHAVPPPQC